MHLPTISENGMGTPVKVQLQFSLNSERLMTTRVLVSNLLVIKDRVDTEETTPSATGATNITAGSATKVDVRDVTSWVMKLRIAGARVLQTRIANNNKLHRTTISSNSRAIKVAFSVALKATLRETAPN